MANRGRPKKINITNRVKRGRPRKTNSDRDGVRRYAKRLVDDIQKEASKLEVVIHIKKTGTGKVSRDHFSVMVNGMDIPCSQVSMPSMDAKDSHANEVGIYFYPTDIKIVSEE